MRTKVALLTALLLPVITFGASQNKLTPIERTVLSLPMENISTKEKNDLIHMLEEEKLARDVYLFLYKKWKLPIFKNIAKAEEWHMHMVEIVLQKYKIDYPAIKEQGKFQNSDLANLYKNLIESGSKSIINALSVGATIEDLDISDLIACRKRADNKDIQFVYSNIEKGSRNHMRAFVKVLRNLGGDYTPRYISQEYFVHIMSTKHEAGPIGIYASDTSSSYMKYSTPSGNHIEGTVKSVYQLPGIRNKKVKWWMVDVMTQDGLVKVAVAPDWIVDTVHISVGDHVEVDGFQGFYSFVACKFKDKNSGFYYESKIQRCKK